MSNIEGAPRRGWLGVLRVALLSAAGSILLFRAFTLWTGVDVLTAHSERRFLGFAFQGDSGTVAFFARVAPGKREGETVCIANAGGGRPPDWLRVMATYAFSHQPVVVASSRREMESPPCRARALTIRPVAYSFSPGRRLGNLARIALGFALCAGVGSSLLSRPRGRFGRLSPRAWPTAAAAGLAVCVPVFFIAGLCGLPIGGAIVPICLALAVGLRFLRGARREETLSEKGPPDSARVFTAGSLALASALLLFAWKIAAVPVWCWDHYTGWGMKARQMMTGGFLDLVFLRALPTPLSNPDYPLGLPLAWRILALGEEPSAVDFKIFHVLFGACVVVTMVRLLEEAGVDRAWRTGLALLVAVSPLFWDTETLGIAEMPLCWFSLAGLGLMLSPAPLSPRLGWIGGCVIGFLPWIKKEGLSLALLLFAAAFAIRRSRRDDSPPAGLRAAGIALFALCASAVLVERLLLPPGLSFFEGSWWLRVRARLPHVGYLFVATGREALSTEWFGFWMLFAGAIALALWRRRVRALCVLLVVLAQLAAYSVVYLATYLNALAHIEASFFRLMGPLLPLGAVGVGLLRSERGGLRPDRHLFLRPRRTMGAEAAASAVKSAASS